ncbi:uncharacterized protein BJ171DRAFT_578266 [Polychytrium aggregatum]|uniref:uncharacterized protein n=1 Tax=Polychytrium aggregatum TaxID=110093 RepID=UPI0022FDB952|nr:uncharacterized protein BJ171DRAFT_578266 [Polychytrium aggregatum]KAI9207798.1 hypothetical protein BJ171DRAFT_578266 [Polychytrium aggregatum]
MEPPQPQWSASMPPYSRKDTASPSILPSAEALVALASHCVSPSKKPATISTHPLTMSFQPSMPISPTTPFQYQRSSAVPVSGDPKTAIPFPGLAANPGISIKHVSPSPIMPTPALDDFPETHSQSEAASPSPINKMSGSGKTLRPPPQRKTPEQVAFLLTAYEINRYPSRNDINTLAGKTKLSSDQVRFWFQDARTREKRTGQLPKALPPPKGKESSHEISEPQQNNPFDRGNSPVSSRSSSRSASPDPRRGREYSFSPLSSSSSEVSLSRPRSASRHAKGSSVRSVSLSSVSSYHSQDGDLGSAQKRKKMDSKGRKRHSKAHKHKKSDYASYNKQEPYPEQDQQRQRRSPVRELPPAVHTQGSFIFAGSSNLDSTMSSEPSKTSGMDLLAELSTVMMAAEESNLKKLGGSAISARSFHQDVRTMYQNHRQATQQATQQAAQQAAQQAKAAYSPHHYTPGRDESSRESPRRQPSYSPRYYEPSGQDDDHQPPPRTQTYSPHTYSSAPRNTDAQYDPTEDRDVCAAADILERQSRGAVWHNDEVSNQRRAALSSDNEPGLRIELQRLQDELAETRKELRTTRDRNYILERTMMEYDQQRRKADDMTAKDHLSKPDELDGKYSDCVPSNNTDADSPSKISVGDPAPVPNVSGSAPGESSTELYERINRLEEQLRLLQAESQSYKEQMESLESENKRLLAEKQTTVAAEAL